MCVHDSKDEGGPDRALAMKVSCIQGLASVLLQAMRIFGLQGCSDGPNGNHSVDHCQVSEEYYYSRCSQNILGNSAVTAGGGFGLGESEYISIEAQKLAGSRTCGDGSRGSPA